MSPRRNIWTIGLLLATILVSCSPVGREEAERVVAQADSLRAEGQMYGDSVQLAQAYRTLKRRSFLDFRLASPFAHACYHYGRLLRAQDDPVSAMQVFIDATHSHTRDYHILGRVYSNMGDIAHLTGEFPLAYEMYKLSGDNYLHGGDTLLYYYDLNNMAFELAEQCLEEETFALLAKIEINTKDKGLIAKVLETKANLYSHIEQYNSVISIVTHLQSLGYCSSTAYVMKAQALWYSNQKDSALYYARYVLNLPKASEKGKYNMLYIVMNGDNTLSPEDMLELTALRSDIETDILIPLHNQWAVAVNLLKQDLSRKPNLQWLYAIIATLLLIGTSLGLYVSRKRQQHQLLTQKVNDLKEIQHATKLQHEQIIKEHTNYKNGLATQIERISAVYCQSSELQKDLCWQDFTQLCTIINQQFFFFAQKLQNTNVLNEREIRLCILVLIGISNSKKQAELLYYSESGIRNFKNRIAKKLGTTSVDLRTFLINLAIN